MRVKAIVRNNIRIIGKVVSDEERKALDCYYESAPFDVEEYTPLDDILHCALAIVKPHTQHMYRDTIDLV